MIVSNVYRRPSVKANDIILTPKRKAGKLQREFNAPLQTIVVERNGSDIDAIVGVNEAN